MGGWLTTLSCCLVLQQPLRAAESALSEAALASSTNSSSAKIVRIGIAAGTWGGVNRNDATAAIAAWAKVIMQQRGMTVSVDTRLFDSEREMTEALQHGSLDAVSMPSHQFLGLDPQLQPELVYLAVRDRTFTERYVLVVHRSSGISDVRGLRQTKLALHEQPAGMQLLNIFQCDQMVRQPLSCFDSTRKLLAEYSRATALNHEPPSRSAIAQRAKP